MKARSHQTDRRLRADPTRQDIEAVIRSEWPKVPILVRPLKEGYELRWNRGPAVADVMDRIEAAGLAGEITSIAWNVTTLEIAAAL